MPHTIIPKKLDVSLYLVLDTALCNGITGVVDTAKAALENGISMLQLRSEYMAEKEWLEVGMALKNLLRASAVPLIINNRIDMALALDADGVHIGQKDMPPHIVRSLLGPNKYIGLSISTPDELAQAPAELVDYLGIGPVYPTTSKQNTAPPLGIEGLKYMVQHKKNPAVGIGGITPKNAALVMATGINGIGVVSAICGHPQPDQATRALRQSLNP